MRWCFPKDIGIPFIVQPHVGVPLSKIIATTRRCEAELILELRANTESIEVRTPNQAAINASQGRAWYMRNYGIRAA
jgi:hypothetical protein